MSRCRRGGQLDRDFQAGGVLLCWTGHGCSLQRSGCLFAATRRRNRRFAAQSQQPLHFLNNFPVSHTSLLNKTIVKLSVRKKRERDSAKGDK
jgi:hypothetical protein